MSFWRNDPIAAPAASESRGTRGPVRIPDPEGDARRAREEADRAAAAARADAEAARQAGRYEADMADRERRLAAGPVVDAREGEANNAAFYQRARSSLDEINALEGRLGGGRSLPGSAIAALPGGETVLRALPDSIGDSPERRTYERAKLDFVNLILRSDSGAAVPEQEVERAMLTYFPSAGETDPAVLESFRQRREVALEGLRAKAGRLAGAPQQQRQQQEGEQRQGLEQGFRYETVASAIGDDPEAGARAPSGFRDRYAQFLQGLDPAAPVEANAAAIQQFWVDNGGTLRLPADNALEIARARANGEIVTGIDYGGVDEARQAQLEARARSEGLRGPGGGGAMQSVDAFVRGAADVPTLGFADEIAAAGDTIFIGGTMADNLDYQRYIDRRDSRFNPYARFAGQVAGSFALPVGRFGSGVGGMAREGAAFGAGYGIGSGEGDIGDRLVSGAVGAAAGGLTGAGLGAAVQRATPLVNRLVEARGARQAERAAERANFADAALRNPDIPVIRADVPGSTGAQIATAIADRTAFGGRITRARDAGEAALGAQADEAASRFGVAADNAGAGEAIERGVNAYMEASQSRVSKLYDAIPVDGATPATLDETRAALSQVNSRFSSNPDLQTALRDPRLSRWQEALTNGGLSWDDLKAFRSLVGEIIEGPVLSEGTSRGAMRNLYGALSRDMEATVSAQGAGALAAFRAANKAAEERFSNIEEVITPLLGNSGQRSAEQAFQRVQSWAAAKGGDSVRLARLLRAMPPEDAGVVRASIISRLGEAAPGAQNADGNLFSSATFLTNWGKMSDRAKALLFDGEHRQALDDIATLAAGMREGRRFGNTSETTRGAIVGSTVTMILGGLLAPAAAAAGGAALGMQYGLARIMANPRSARWLAALARKPNERAARAHIARLDSIARSEPLIAADVLTLQQRLNEAFAAGPLRVAADENNNESNGVERRD